VQHARNLNVKCLKSCPHLQQVVKATSRKQQIEAAGNLLPLRAFDLSLVWIAP